jgi:hypothetical protein
MFIRNIYEKNDEFLVDDEKSSFQESEEADL